MFSLKKYRNTYTIKNYTQSIEKYILNNYLNNNYKIKHYLNIIIKYIGYPFYNSNLIIKLLFKLDFKIYFRIEYFEIFKNIKNILWYHYKKIDCSTSKYFFIFKYKNDYNYIIFNEYFNFNSWSLNIKIDYYYNENNLKKFFYNFNKFYGSKYYYKSIYNINKNQDEIDNKIVKFCDSLYRKHDLSFYFYDL
jgi:hypothetical protein